MASPSRSAGPRCLSRATSLKAKGDSRGGEFRQFLGTARGSLLEVETQLLIADRLGYVEAKEGQSALALLQEVARILNGLMHSVTENRRT